MAIGHELCSSNVLDSLFIAALIVWGVCWSLFSIALLCALSSFVIVSLRKRELVALL